ncbi:alpha/beta hydrolase [Hymenobacter glaciei]|uniref:Alpha/beta hydrolase n=1 Tax=Hymenobacter glaciei TaxID=877209 RepID=A0ABP7UJS5_9BACT
MRYLRIVLAAVALAWAGAEGVHAQAPSATSAAAPLGIGQTFTLESQALGEKRRINVYLPTAYTDSATVRLPVLYMPDGGIAEDFLHVAGLMQVLTGNGTMRPFILVGIENTQRRRDLTGPTTVAEDKKIAPKVGGSAAYRQFIREELMPQVKQRYRTTAETAIVGESLAGLFVVETLVLEPKLFNTYIAFDPSLWWNNGQLAAQGIKLVGAAGRPATTVYLATSSQGELKTTRQLVEAGGTEVARTGAWHYEPMPEETHATIYHPAALRAFRAVFKPQAKGKR